VSPAMLLAGSLGCAWGTRGLSVLLMQCGDCKNDGASFAGDGVEISFPVLLHVVKGQAGHLACVFPFFSASHDR